MHNKIYIFGGTGAGKTTFAKKLSEILNIPFYTTDMFVYRKDWKSKYSEKERGKRVADVAKKKKWIVEGVHRSLWITPIFKKADYVIILDINVFMRYIHVIKRYFERRKSKNPDDIKITLKILNWTRKYTHGHLPDHKRLIKLHKKEFIILKNKKQMNSFIETLKPSR